MLRGAFSLPGILVFFALGSVPSVCFGDETLRDAALLGPPTPVVPAVESSTPPPSEDPLLARLLAATRQQQDAMMDTIPRSQRAYYRTLVRSTSAPPSSFTPPPALTVRETRTIHTLWDNLRVQLPETHSSWSR